MNGQFYHLQDIDTLRHLVWLLPLLTALYLHTRSRRNRALMSFAGSNPAELFRTDRLPGRSGWKIVLLALALSCLLVALARPGWNPEPVAQVQKGREVVFLLDVSRSMLAKDMRPSRLERAKLAIQDCLSKMRGDRAGLVVFAGSAQTLCPLTIDYSFLRLALAQASPQSVDRGGTILCDAIRKASGLLNNTGSAHKDIILITDGGDEGDAEDAKFAQQAAAEAAAKNIRIITIGIGDEKNGQRIPLEGRDGKQYFLMHEGKEVWTKLNAPLLRSVSAASHEGKYVNVGTGDFDLGALYAAMVGNAEKGQLMEKKALQYQEKFQIFLLAALLLLCAELMLRERKPVPAA